MLVYSFSFLYALTLIKKIYIKGFVHHQLCLNCILNFKSFKNSIIIFEYYKMLSEWFQSAP